MGFQRSRITFKPLESDDLVRMYQWLRDPAVSKWYGTAPETLAEVEGKYLPRIWGHIPVRCLIVEYDETPVAYIQTYRIDHDPAYAEALNVHEDAVGIDLFIGESTFRYQGFGSLMLREFAKRIVFAEVSTSCCVIAPSVSNISAIRAYEKAGFRHIKSVSVPNEPEPEYVMILWPDDLETE